jgi:hypothetical protein
MKKILFLICMFFAPLAFTACSVEDNPCPDYTVNNMEEPQEEVTDQPALAPNR